jgi:hypothetical protein
MKEIFAALAKFFEQAAKTPFVANVQAAALRDIETLWNTPEHGVRLVFQP